MNLAHRRQDILNLRPARQAEYRTPLPCRAWFEWETGGRWHDTNAVGYDPKTGDVWVQVPGNTELTSWLSTVWLGRDHVRFPSDQVPC